MTEDSHRRLGHARSPRTTLLEIMYGCNYGCAYCYVGYGKNHSTPSVPRLDSLVPIIDELDRIQIEEVVLLGGEPVLHPDLEALCRAIARTTIASRGIVTNGSNATHATARVLRECGFWVDVTFRGASDVFDSVAGRQGAFRSAVEAVKVYSDAGISVGIEYDCIPENASDLYDVIRSITENVVPIRQVQLHRILPEGDAQGQMSRFRLSINEWQRVFSQAVRIRDDLGVPIFFEDGFPLCLLEESARSIVTPCACGFTSVTVSPNGDARYCSCHEKSVGNILSTPLEHLWDHEMDEYWDASRLPTACQTCDLMEICRGGCSASGGASGMGGFDEFSENFRPIQLGSKPSKVKRIQGQVVVEFEPDAR